MPPKSDPSTARRRRSGGGGGWLVLFVIAVAAGGACFFAGDKIRDLLGIGRKPGTDGAEPTVPSDTTANLVEKTPPESSQASGPVQLSQTAKPVEVAPTPVVAKPIVPNADQDKADKLLAQAESAYRTFQWEPAVNYANGVLNLNCSQADLIRAHVIKDSAPELAKLFTRLDDKDELVRNYDTSPGLVRIDGGSEPLYAVAVANDDSKDPVLVVDDAATYITNALKAGPVHAMVLGSKEFIYTTLPDTVTTVRLVDQKQVRSQKLSEFESKLGRLKNSAAANSALAWYAAAKFAYRNRLDDHVTEMLDQAIDLDPDLVKSVREEKAGKLCSAMVLHLKSGSRKQAEIYMGIIRRKYSDTDQGKQASLIFDGKMQELVAMASEEEKQRKQQEEQRQQARIDRAKQEGDEARAQAIAQEKPPADDSGAGNEASDPAAPGTTSAPVSGDEASAQEGDGRWHGDLPRGDRHAADHTERNGKYWPGHQFLFRKAVAMYSALSSKDPNNIDLQAKMVEANKMKFGCEKYMTVDF